MLGLFKSTLENSKNPYAERNSLNSINVFIDLLISCLRNDCGVIIIEAHTIICIYIYILERNKLLGVRKSLE